MKKLILIIVAIMLLGGCAHPMMGKYIKPSYGRALKDAEARYTVMKHISTHYKYEIKEGLILYEGDIYFRRDVESLKKIRGKLTDIEWQILLLNSERRVVNIEYKRFFADQDFWKPIHVKMSFPYRKEFIYYLFNYNIKFNRGDRMY